LSGDNGLTTIDGPAADPVMLELDGVMAEIEALLVDALLDVILPLIIELESTSLVPADPIFELCTAEL